MNNEEDKKAKISAADISYAITQAIYQTFDEYTDGPDGVLAFVGGKKKDVKLIRHWDERVRRWCDDLDFTGHRDSLSSLIYYGKLEPLLREISEGALPLIQQEGRLMRCIEEHIQRKLGVKEESLDAFDRREVEKGRTKGLISQFLFGDYGVCQIYRNEDGSWRLEKGAANKKDYKLMRDFDDGRIATDEEYAAGLPEVLKLFRPYCGYYEVEEETRLGWGNVWLEDKFLCYAAPFVPVDLVPQVYYYGPGGLGKGAFEKTMGWIFGSQIMITDCHAATITEGYDDITGPRLLQERGKLRGPRIAVALDAPAKGKLDTGFIKNLCPRDEIVHIGGMFQDSISVDLRVLYIQITNHLLRHSDSSGGTQRRQRIFLARNEAFVSEGGESELSHYELRDKFAGREHVVRRMLFEAQKHLVEVCRCKMPTQHPLLLEDWREANKQSQWSLITDMKKALRKVKASVGKDDADWEFRSSARAKYRLRLGQLTSTAGVKNSRPVHAPREGKKEGESYNGILLLCKVLLAAGGDESTSKKLKQSAVSGLLDEMGFHKQEGRSGYPGVVHTDWLIETLLEFYGDPRDVREVIAAMYNNGECPLTPAQEDLLSKETNGAPRREQETKTHAELVADQMNEPDDLAERFPPEDEV